MNSHRISCFKAAAECTHLLLRLFGMAEKLVTVGGAFRSQDIFHVCILKPGAVYPVEKTVIFQNVYIYIYIYIVLISSLFSYSLRSFPWPVYFPLPRS